MSACTAFSAAESPTLAPDGSGPSRAPDATADAGAPDATSDGPSAAAAIVIKDVGVATFSIDAKEISVAEFRRFKNTVAFDAKSLPPLCAGKTAFGPGASCPFLQRDDLPVHCVDWCDASAYCAWAGKRLCGKRGGGPVPVADFQDPNKDEWTRACAGPLSPDRYAYGLDAEAARCNTGVLEAGAPVAPGSMTSCEGSVSGLFDMSGNVGEWEDSCEVPSDSKSRCLIRGGSFTHPLADSRCRYGVLGPHDAAFGDVGIRCCSDPP